jgi:hypothetical protein
MAEEESLESKSLRAELAAAKEQLARRSKPVGLGGIVARFDTERKWLKNATEAVRAGVGAVEDANGGPVGFGASVDATGIATEVWQYLAAGSPRLALARALGVRFAPYMINVTADFDSTDVVDIPATGSDVKIVQDTIVDAMVLEVLNQSNTANLTVFQPQSDYFYTFQSGLEATLDVQGAPRYAVADKFTPLKTLCDLVTGTSHWPAGWILTYQQQVFMAFNATVTLPFAPIRVTVSFRTRIPTGELFVEMTNSEALAFLAEKCGIVVTDAYRDRVLTYTGKR